jgi:hypothetical protein
MQNQRTAKFLAELGKEKIIKTDKLSFKKKRAKFSALVLPREPHEAN